MMAKLKVFEGGRSHDDLTVSEAREFMNEHLYEGTECLVCGRLCKCHRRNISSYFETLQTVDAAAPRGSWVKIADLNLKNGDYAKLRYWELMEKGADDRWRVTLRGHDFLDGKIGVPRFALVFNKICQGLEGGEVYARDLGGGS
jgi:hypothetical protein